MFSRNHYLQDPPQDCDVIFGRTPTKKLPKKWVQLKTKKDNAIIPGQDGFRCHANTIYKFDWQTKICLIIILCSPNFLQFIFSDVK